MASSRPAQTPPALAAAAQLLASDPAKAAEQTRRFLDSNPGHDEARLLLAVALRNSDRLNEALELLGSLAAAHPDWQIVQYEIGLALSAQGSWLPAMGALRRAVELDPSLSGAWRALGDAHYALGEAAEADEAYERFVTTAQTDPLLRQAVEALDGGRADIAESNARMRLRYVPTDIVAMRILAEICANTGRTAEAESLLVDCIARAPGYWPAQYEYVQLLLRLGRWQEAATGLERLLGQRPDDGALLNLKAITLANLGDFDGAAELARHLLQLDFENPRSMLRLGHLLRANGTREEAIDLFNRAIAKDPKCGEAYLALANLRNYEFTEFEAEAMAIALEDKELHEDTRIAFRFALGRALDQLGRYEEAFQHFAAGNALKRMRVNYDAQEVSAVVRRSCNQFTQAFFAERAGSGTQDRDPIFIVGLPRSGSTLIEQILSAHSAVEGLGEMRQMISLAGEIVGPAGDARYPQALEKLSAEEFSALGKRYLESVRPMRRSTRPFFTDKTAPNFLHTGLIQLMLPNARIIDIRRHPLACGFSNFSHLFGAGHEFAYRLSEIGRFYRDYVMLMAHYDRVMPGRIHRIVYEDLVAEPERHIRALLDHCGLPFEEACLRPHENRRTVVTPSSEQVRQPIAAEGSDHWRHYDTWLAPLKTALGSVIDTYPAVPADL